jgi:hypothetical protein
MNTELEKEHKYSLSVSDDYPKNVKIYDDIKELAFNNRGKVIHIELTSDGFCIQLYQNLNGIKRRAEWDGIILDVKKRSRDVFIKIKEA